MDSSAVAATADAVPLHAASVGVCLHYLQRLGGWLDAAEAHAHRDALSIDSLLQARLAPDMLPLHAQVATAAYFTLRACFPLAGRPVPPWVEHPATLDGLRARITDAQRHLQGLAPAAFKGAAGRVVEAEAGQAQLALPADEFLTRYALPNVFFHLGMAYAILRAHGVPLGKADFDGYHRYPPVAVTPPPPR